MAVDVAVDVTVDVAADVAVPPGERREHASYVVVPAAGGGWGAVAAALASKLRVLDRCGTEHFVVLEDADPDLNLFAQWWVHGGDEVYGEAVSSTFTELFQGPLTAEQEGDLSAAGWTPPDESPNWSQEWTGPARHHLAALAGIHALTCVYGVAESRLVRLQVFPAWDPEDPRCQSGGP